MRAAACMLLALALAGAPASAEFASVAASLGQDSAWVGQRVPLLVELRARGPFQGTASFSIPELAGVLVVKLGTPMVSSQEIDGQSVFVQTHEFALFSQVTGMLELPPFAVRFASRDGFDGPVGETRASTGPLRVELRRPPGSEGIGFLASTGSLELSEQWDPQPGTATVGSVIRRTIVQRAAELPGMALAPVPPHAARGVRVYPGTPETRDQLERGDFLGERRDTLSYLLQEPGTVRLPELRYEWWDPQTGTLSSHTLPAVEFEVSAAPVPGLGSGLRRTGAWWLLAAGCVVLLLAWRRKQFVALLARLHAWIDPPSRATARALLRACARNDAGAAHRCWSLWRNTQAPRYRPDAALAAAVRELERHLYGPAGGSAWDGAEFARCVRATRRGERARTAPSYRYRLPPLNP